MNINPENGVALATPMDRGAMPIEIVKLTVMLV
jgi:hypothetical protein